jgi:hypothetical protein
MKRLALVRAIKTAREKRRRAKQHGVNWKKDNNAKKVTC